MHFMTSKWSTKRSGFVIFHILKTMYLQQLKGMRSAKLGIYVKGVTLLIEGIHLSNRVYKKGKGLDLGAEPTRITLY